MKKNVDIIHIYAGTSGSAGLYINEIYCALKDKYKQEVIVNFYFPFKYGKKIFYKYSELSSPFLKKNKTSRTRHIIRAIELFSALFYTYILIVFFRKTRLVNYNLTSDLKIEFWFLFLLKKIHNIQIAITCHDVLPFKSSFIKPDKQIARKQKFFNLASVLFIHNDNSFHDLLSYYSIDSTIKIIQFPFPLMDLNKIGFNIDSKPYFHIKKTKFRFGMVGHLRAEKGLPLLIDAWDKFYLQNKDVELVIAGNLPIGESYDFNKIINKNLILIDRFISDIEYKQIISSCDVVILPYLRGTNSGIPSSILLQNVLILTSDIDMFKRNPIIHEKFTFESGDVDSLIIKMSWYLSLSDDQKKDMLNSNKTILNNYQNDFIIHINNCYASLLG